MVKYIHPSSVVVGSVSLGDDVSIWPCAVIRADIEKIVIGSRSNIQDNCVIHVASGFPASIGDDVSIGHGAIIHGATVSDRCIIGMGAILLNGSLIGEDCIVGAGALIPEGAQIPPGSLVLGLPGKVIRELTGKEKQSILENAEEYLRLRPGN